MVTRTLFIVDSMLLSSGFGITMLNVPVVLEGPLTVRINVLSRVSIGVSRVEFVKASRLKVPCGVTIELVVPVHPSSLVLIMPMSVFIEATSPCT